MTLHKMKNGTRCRLDQIDPSSSCLQRLQELGFTQGEEITVLRRAPLGGPIQVMVRGSSFAIGQDEARLIRVTKQS